MNEFDKELVFSEAVKAGKRIYYFDVRQSRNGDRYLSITESKKILEGPAENPTFRFEKHKLFLYKEDYEKFVNALNKVVEVAQTGEIPIKEEQYDYEAPANSDVPAPKEVDIVAEKPAPEAKEETDSFKIDLDF